MDASERTPMDDPAVRAAASAAQAAERAYRAALATALHGQPDDEEDDADDDRSIARTMEAIRLRRAMEAARAELVAAYKRAARRLARGGRGSGKGGER